MSEAIDPVDAPLLIIVNGRPATGKTWLAERLSSDLGIPLFTKDEVKELLGDVVGAEDRESARALGEASIHLIFEHAEAVLLTGQPAIIECPLIPDLSVEPIAKIQQETGCRLLQLFLRADPEVILERYERRHRNEVHFDQDAFEELKVSLRTTEVDPVPIDGDTVILDTTDFESVDVDALVSQIQAAIDPAATRP